MNHLIIPFPTGAISHRCTSPIQASSIKHVATRRFRRSVTIRTRHTSTILGQAQDCIGNCGSVPISTLAYVEHFHYQALESGASLPDPKRHIGNQTVPRRSIGVTDGLFSHPFDICADHQVIDHPSAITCFHGTPRLSTIPEGTQLSREP